MTALLKDAFKPNLVQTLEGTPAIIHGGPFANIAHGCNSIIATKLALNLGDYVVTEAGFGADLGAEKFLDIKCRNLKTKPSAVVMVATIRALKMHGGLDKSNLDKEDLDALKKGFPNLLRHVANVKNVYNLPVIVALNKFSSDTSSEIELIINECNKLDVKVVLSEVWEKGSSSGIDLANEIIKMCEEKTSFNYCYELSNNIEEKIKSVVQRIYHGKDIALTDEAKEQIAKIENMGYGNLPICIAKTQYSFSDDPKKLGAPEDFTITIKEVKLSGFIVVLTGDIMTMPGLPKVPAAERIDVNDDGKIIGIF